MKISKQTFRSLECHGRLYTIQSLGGFRPRAIVYFPSDRLQLTQHRKFQRN